MSGFSPTKLGEMIKMAATSIHLLCISYAVCMVICCLPVIDSQVPDGFVYTDLHKTARKGDELVLKCQFYGSPFVVYWKKGDDPYNSPDLINWVEGESQSGPCVRDHSCSMDGNYSLIIKDIGIANQGMHICLVSNYLGILIHNFTEVTVFAPPMEPFPVINECPVKHPNDTEQTCRLSSSDKVTITCSVSGYFPDIDLFFLQGSQHLGTATTEEATNPDETKNKSISVVTEPSKTRYVCVASNIPGWRDQRTVSIEVNFPEVIVNTTIHSRTTVPDRGVAKVVVPVVLVIILLVIVFCFAGLWWRRRKPQRRKPKGDSKAMPPYEDPETGVLSPGENRRISLSFKRSVLRRWLFQGLLRPHDVIYHEGKYFITDTGHHCVSSYHPATDSHTTECRVLWSRLYGLASLSDPDQGILVTDNSGGRIYRINHSVRYDWASGLNAPTGITTHNGEVFVAEFYTNYIKVYDEKGNHLRNFDSTSHLKQPWFLAVNSKNHLYVADSEAIKIFTTVGEYIESFKISNDGNWLNRGITIDCDDNVFVTARDGRARDATETIVVFNSEHRCVKRISSDIDSLHYIRGLCINYDRNELAVVDGEWHRIKLFELYEPKTLVDQQVSLFHSKMCSAESTSGSMGSLPYMKENLKSQEKLQNRSK